MDSAGIEKEAVTCSKCGRAFDKSTDFRELWQNYGFFAPTDANSLFRGERVCPQCREDYPFCVRISGFTLNQFEKAGIAVSAVNKAPNELDMFYVCISKPKKQEIIKPEGIGFAVMMMKAGHRVRRAGWNGKGMFVFVSFPEPRETPAAQFWSKHGRKFAEENGGSATVLPYVLMKTADDKIVPWLCSQTDLLAEDWELC